MQVVIFSAIIHLVTTLRVKQNLVAASNTPGASSVLGNYLRSGYKIYNNQLFLISPNLKRLNDGVFYRFLY